MHINSSEAWGILSGELRNKSLIELVGLGIRVPGASTQEEFWSVLRQKRCTVSQIPEERWSRSRFWHPRVTEPGKSYTFAAGVLDDLWGFDPAAFGISPREAEQLDPQQRLLLQVTWEAIEDAGIAPSALAGQAVGVYVGASTLDYSIESFFDPGIVTGHFMTGNTLSVISNRLSYIFDLNGPSFTVDTACSSSLVAMNEAVRALKSGEIDTAIVAGVNALISPFPFIGFAQATMLSPEGLCRAFDARGLGYVRSEGCLAFVLRRKEAAAWPGQEAIADIVDIGINADGKTVGMSLPSQTHQARLLGEIYERAGIDLDDLAFIEAHGTGTRVGDPAEAQSVGLTLAKPRNSALPIGSVKTNIGHLEPASGLAGIAKACLALKHDLLPASLHCEEPNPDIDFDGLNLKLAHDAVPLERTGSQRYAGVNSFGFGGTNAHVLLSDPSGSVAGMDDAQAKHETAGLLVLSAKSKEAIAELARTYSLTLEGLDADDLKVVQSAAWYRKNHFDEKLVVKGRDPATVAEALEAFAGGEKSEAVVTGKQSQVDGRCAFVFSGNGAQWPGMGRAAHLNNAQFRDKFEEIDREFATLSGVSLTALLFSDELADDLHLTSTAQPLLFAIQVSLCVALAELGLRPDVVIGHSIGEAAAAVVSGKMTLAEGVKLVYHRSREQEAVAGAGSMAALVLPRDEALEVIQKADCGQIELAAVNSPKSVTLSGRKEDLSEFGKFARQSHLAFRKIDLNYPFHSSMVETVERPFKEALGEIEGRDSETVFISTVSGEEMRGSDLDTRYWWRNLREPVQFDAAIGSAIAQGVRSFIEIGPKPILQSYIRQCALGQDTDVAILGSLLTKQEMDADPIVEIVADALVHGVRVDEAAVFGLNPAVALKLPSYPWQNQAFRFQNTSESNSGLLRGNEHPLLGWRSEDTLNQWTAHVDTQVLPFLADHEIDGQIIFPGSAYIEIALAAAQTVLGAEKVEIRDLDIVQAIFLSDSNLTEIQTRFFAETGTFEISSRRRLSDDDFALNARGRVFKAVYSDLPVAKGAKENVGNGYAASDIYRAARSFGLNYGAAFRRATHIDKTGTNSYRIHFVSGNSNHVYRLHPAELDACFHGIFAVLADKTELLAHAKAYVPVHFDKLQLIAPGQTPAFAEISVRRVSEWSVLADFVLFDTSGEVIATISGGRFRAVSFGARERSSDLVFHFRSEPLDGHACLSDETSAALAAPDRYLPDLAAGDFRELVASEEVESRLLLEAAAQRLAIDVLSVLKTRHGAIRETDFPERLRLYLNALLNWLVHVEAVVETHPGTYELTDLESFPEFDLLINTVLRESPVEIAAVTLLARCRSVAMSIASGGEEVYEPPSAMLDQFRFASPDALARLELLKDWLAPFVENWPDDKPLRVLDLAGSGLDIARHLVGARPFGAAFVTVLDPDPSSASRLVTENDAPSYIEVLDASSDRETLRSKPFDLVLSSGRLHEFSGIGGMLRDLAEARHGSMVFAAIEPERSMLAEAILGLHEGSLVAAIGDQFPISNLRSGAEWVSAIKIDAGFDKVDAERAVVRGHPASLVRGYLAGSAPQYDVPSEEKDKKTAWVIAFGKGRQERENAEALATKISENGDYAETLFAGSNIEEAGFPEAFARLCKKSEFSEATQRIIVSLPRQRDKAQTSVEAVSRQCLNAVSIAKATDAGNFTLALVAPSGSGARDLLSPDHAEQSALWSFSRVLQNEFPDLDVRRLDVSLDEGSAAFAEAVLESLAGHPGENDVVGENEATRNMRVVRGFRKTATETPSAVTLGFEQPGSLSALTWRSTQRRDPEPDQVEIEVVATGLNFRDVMWSLGMLPEEALEDGYGGPSLGLECSGRVVRTGVNVEHLKAGDPVVAFSRGGFSSHVTVPGYAVAKLDENQDLVGAASVPVAFLTAYYSLIKLGELKQDQWLLIHGGAGGVGLAALQIAKSVGARVIATAGSKEKRDLLGLLGADHVLDSRSLEFSVEVLSLTGGEGVDAVLNSLAGEAMERSLEVVRPFGRFLELGKRDFYENTKIGLRPFRKNVSYFGIDVDQLLSHDLAGANDLIRQVFEHLRSGEFSLLPFRLYKGQNVRDAFRLMQRSGHIGKILVAPPSPEEVLEPVSPEPLAFDNEGFHVVVGGLGGFGAEVTRWLADHGAQRIALTSRSGLVSDQHAELIDELAGRGVEVRAFACDVTERNSLDTVLKDLRAEAPLKGIIHAAMVLADGRITSQDADSFKKALEPKIAGAVLLDELTANDALDHFILFSSIATLVGNPGQANYVAANGFLEGLARERRQRGLPGLAVGWGAIKDVGFLARNTEVSDKISKVLGSAMIEGREGLDILAEALKRDQGEVEDAVLFIGRIDWMTMSQTLPLLKQGTFGHLAKATSGSAAPQGVLDIAALIAGKSEAEAKQTICGLLARELGEILRLPAEEIGFKRPLAEFGMDSLMGLELRMGIQKRFNLEIPLVSLSGGTCIEDFAEQILKRLGPDMEDADQLSGTDLLRDDLATQHLGTDLTEDQKKVVSRLIDSEQKKIGGLLQ